MGSIDRRAEEYLLNLLERHKFTGETPPAKKTLAFNLATDFRAATTGWETELAGRQIAIVPIPYQDYKYIWLPPNVVDCYLHDRVTGFLTPVIYKHFIPVANKDLLIIARPPGMSAGYMYFQYYLTDLMLCNVYDTHEESFDVPADGNYRIEPPFPTYQMKLLFEIGGVNVTSYDFDIAIRPTNDATPYTLDALAAIAGVVGINNYYLYDWIGGSDTVTDPNLPFPSWRTQITFQNNDAGAAITQCVCRLVSWEHTEWGQ